MTKKFFISLSTLILMLCSAVSAQNIPVIAYVNTTELIEAVPEKAQATQKLTALSDSYKAELQLIQTNITKNIQILLPTKAVLLRISNFVECKNSPTWKIKCKSS